MCINQGGKCLDSKYSVPEESYMLVAHHAVDYLPAKNLPPNIQNPKAELVLLNVRSNVRQVCRLP